MNFQGLIPDRSSARPAWRFAVAFGMVFAGLSRMADASEMASLAVEISRTAVVMHHHAVNPRSVQPTRVTINHQGDACHFEAIVVWTSGPFGAQIGSTPRRAVIYGSLVNRSELRRLYDLEYIEAPDRPWIGCDNAPKVITYWNSVFARGDSMSTPRELGQPLHRSQHPQPECQVCPTCPRNSEEPHEHAARPFPVDGTEVLEGQALTQLLHRDSAAQQAGAESPAVTRVSWLGLPPIRTGRRPSAAAIPDTELMTPARSSGAR